MWSRGSGYRPAVWLLLLACGEPAEREHGTAPDSTPESTDSKSGEGESPPLESGADSAPSVPCGSLRQAWADEALEGHTPWFLSVGERALLGTLHDTEAAHVLEFVGDDLVDLGAPSETETAIWQIVEVDGAWYGGTYPNAKLVAEGEDLGPLWDEATSAFTLATEGGWIHAGLGPERSAIASYELATGRIVVLEGARSGAYGEVFEGDDGVVYGVLDEASYRFVDGVAEEVERVGRGARIEAAGQWVEQLDNVEGASPVLDLQVRDPETWHLRSEELDYEGAGLTVHALGAIDGLVVGSTILPNEVFSYTGDFEHLGHVGDGEMYSVMMLDGTVWMAEYPSGALWAYDPDTDWDLGTNPVSYELGTGHLRPLALEPGDRGAVWVGSVAGYGVPGGALAHVEQGVVTNYREPFVETGVVAVAWDGDTRSLALAADGIWWWDIDTAQVEGKLNVPTPWVMEAIAGRLYAVTWDMEVIVVDLRTREVIHREATGLGNSRRHSLKRKKDRLWGVASWGLYSLDPENYTFAQEALAPDTIDVGGAYGDDGITFASGSELWFFSLATLGFTRLGEPVEGGLVLDRGALGDDALALIKAGERTTVAAVEICPPEDIASTELLTNGGFEDDEGWEDWGGDWGEGERASEPHRSGTSSMHVEAGSVGGYVFQRMDEGLDASVSAGVWAWLPESSAPERIRFELYLSGPERYAWGQTEIDMSTYPRGEWVLLGPFDGEISGDYSDSMVHIGVLGDEGAHAFFDDVSVRRYD